MQSDPSFVESDAVYSDGDENSDREDVADRRNYSIDDDTERYTRNFSAKPARTANDAAVS